MFHRYSTNQDISRARQAFFSGRKSFLLISERFHFFRRCVLSGVCAIYVCVRLMASPA